MNSKHHHSILARAAMMLLVALLMPMTTWAQYGAIYAGFTATDGTQNSSTATTEGYAKLVDGKYTSDDFTKWGTSTKGIPPGESNSCYWVDFHSDEPITVGSYIFTTGNDNSSYMGRNPKSWVLKAKLNESDDWTTVATVTDDGVLQDVNYANYEYNLDVPGTYQYFRLMINGVKGDSSGFLQLGELRLKSPLDPKLLSNAVVNGLSSSYLYTGNTIDISYTVLAADGTELNSTEHYDAVLSRDGTEVTEVKEKGAYTLTLTAKAGSGYSGEKRVSFQVNNEIQIGSGSSESSLLPTTSTYNYVLTQQIYTKEELGMSGTISSIAFKNVGTEKTRNLDIYFVLTDKSSFTSNTEWISVTDADKVFSGEVTFTAGEWTTISLEVPFTYINTENLAVIVDDNTGSWSSGLKCLSFSGLVQALYKNSDTIDFNPATPPSGDGSTMTSKSQIILEITPGDAPVFSKPTNLTVDDVTAETATLSWTAPEGDVTGYVYEYKSAVDESWSAEATINSTSVTLEGLTGGTYYSFRVKAIYADGESLYASIKFMTDCATITSFPWTENFEGYNAGNFANPCWVNEHIEGSGNKIFVISTQSVDTNETHLLELPDQSDGTKTKLMLPLMYLPSNNYLFVLDVYRSKNSTSKINEGIRVFVSTDGEIEGATELAFIPRVHSVGNSMIPAESDPGWYTYELPIGVDGLCYIILRGESQYGEKTSMDNFIVMEAPSCIMPVFTVNNISDTEATLTWSGGSGTYNVQYKEAEAEEWTDVLIDTEETSFTLTNLTPTTAYEARVQGVCSADDTSTWREVSFKTINTTEFVEDSWSDDFEGGTCDWELINGELTNVWTWGSAVNNGGEHALYISNDDGVTNAYTINSGTMVYAVKPLTFAEGKYEFSYDWKANGESTYDFMRVALVPTSVELVAGTSLLAGYTATSLPSGWIALDGGNKLNLSSEWQRKSAAVHLDGTYYLVFGWRNDTSSGNQPPAAIDNVSISRISCAFDAEDIDVNDISTTTATLTWTGDASQWHVAYSTDSMFEGASEVVVDEPTCFLTDLSPSTHYYVKVRSYCGDEDFGSWSDVLQFNTDCVIVTEYPWSENFDNYVVPSSTQIMPVCWNAINSDSDAYPTIYSDGSTTDSNSAPNCLRFYSYINFFSPSSSAFPQYAVLPAMENLQGKQLSLQAKGNNNSSTFRVGMMTDPNDVSTFTEIATNALTTSYQQFFFMLTGEGNYVAIMIDAANSISSSNGAYIDDIVISNTPVPTDLTVIDQQPTAVTLSWTENGTATAWQICLNDGNEETIIDVTENPYTIENLIPETSYTVKIRAVCGDDMSGWSNTVTFEPTEKWMIGSGTATNNYLPLSNYYKYSLTEQIYTVAEMGEAGLIESIDFFKNNTIECIRDLDIYMLNTDKDVFNSKTDWISATADDLVFSGNVTFADNAWTTITLDNPFIYDGTRNVAIIIKDHSGTYKATTSFLAFTADGQAIYCCKDEDEDVDPTNPTIEGAILNTKNQIRILKSPLGSCMKPTNLTVNEVGPDCATLSWIENGEATSWVIDCNGTTIEVTEIPYTLTGLTMETEYTVKVRPDCDENLWSREITFTTTIENPVPTNLTASNLRPTAATLSWTGFGDSYNVKYKVETSFKEDFEDETAFNDRWTFISMNTENTSGNHGAGIHESAARNGLSGFRFSSYNNCNDYNQYLISPELTVSGALEFYYRCYRNSNEKFKVGYSTTTNDLESFNWSDEIVLSSTSWQTYTMELPDDVRYIAINYYTQYNYYLYIDDLSIIPTEESDDDWTTLENIDEKTVEITDLTAGTTYVYQVQSVKGDNISDWSAIASFITEVAPDVATGLNDVSRQNDKGQMIMDNDGWYSLDGRKLNAQPKARGVYIHHGAKVVIK